ncbi:protein RESISTANCE TO PHYTOPHTHORA 1, chloroplastic isoform X2 [Abrus precatorius]|uniref:Protein RESISTANCE TO PHYTOPHTHORA 1, chloroplastic isoform X2 n=1 Tax=Abrus precatorius TaxID=3816 RepID=A0A8B8L682_ABRPR|nr:protein RESISTANCE TO PHYTOPHTHORA 1, chloroplastic isoform X2 [Abrus precatorius]
MNTLISPVSTNCYLSGVPYPFVSSVLNTTKLPKSITTNFLSHSLVRGTLSARATSDELDTQTVDEELAEEMKVEQNNDRTSTFSAPIDKELKKVAQKTAATFAPRASTATKNPAVPGTALYSVFEVQGYASMLLGGALSFNLIFPSNEPDIWRLMGMWSIWMFTIPSLRARDCSKNEKEALNYLFLLVPLLNVAIPFFWKSFAVVWSADVIAFFGMYAWKFGWLQRTD